MKRTSLKFVAIGVIFTIILFSSFSWAYSRIDILTGYSSASLKGKDKYEFIPVYFGFCWPLNGWLQKHNINIKGQVDRIVEPFIGFVFNPDTNLELGVNLLLSYKFPLSERLNPYLKGGLGVVYMTQHTREQSTQYNFLPQAGVGLEYKLSEKMAFNIEYRYRHLSNASFKSPNAGIDADQILFGLGIKF